MKYLFTLLVLFSFHSGQSQSAFTLEDSLVILSRTLDFENVHWYGEIVNVADTSNILMSWKLRTPEGIPANWLTNFDPGTNELLYVTDGDSSRFTLYKDLEFLQKLIIGVKHQGEAGMGRYEFDIHPINNPSDLKTQAYEVSFTEPTAIEEPTFPEGLIYLSDEGFIIHESLQKFSIFSVDGKLLYSTKQTSVGVLNLPQKQDIYVVSFEYKEKRYARRFLDLGR